MRLPTTIETTGIDSMALRRLASKGMSVRAVANLLTAVLAFVDFSVEVGQPRLEVPWPLATAGSAIPSEKELILFNT